MPRDVFQIADLAEMMHAEGRYKSYPFDKKKIVNGLLHQLASMSLVGYIEEQKGKIIGFVVGILDQYSFCDEFMLCGRGLFILPEHRENKTASKLLRAFAGAAKKLGIKEIIMTASYIDNPNSLDLLYKKAGFKKSGYQMDIE